MEEKKRGRGLGKKWNMRDPWEIDKKLSVLRSRLDELEPTSVEYQYTASQFKTLEWVLSRRSEL